MSRKGAVTQTQVLSFFLDREAKQILKYTFSLVFLMDWPLRWEGVNSEPLRKNWYFFYLINVNQGLMKRGPRVGGYVS